MVFDLYSAKKTLPEFMFLNIRGFFCFLFCFFFFFWGGGFRGGFVFAFNIVILHTDIDI